MEHQRYPQCNGSRWPDVQINAETRWNRVPPPQRNRIMTTSIAAGAVRPSAMIGLISIYGRQTPRDR